MELTILSSKNNKWVVSPDKEFFTKNGSIKKEDLKPGNELLIGKTEKFGMKVNIVESLFIDYYSKIKRGAQIITQKDIGSIIAYTGINKSSIVFDCGGGSGGVTCFLANIVKKVYSVEKEKSFIEIIKNNIEKLNLKNIELIEGDLINKLDKIKPFIKEKIDLAVLDLKDAHLSLKTINGLLKLGGFLVGYFSNLEMAKYLVIALEQHGFYKEKILETIERNWKITDNITRPEYEGLSHTGFLIFARKVKEM